MTNRLPCVEPGAPFFYMINGEPYFFKTIDEIMRASKAKERKNKGSIVRVRTGCGTCKQRKIKCDEVKPECSRCTSTGRKCDGYSIITPESLSLQTTTFYSIPFRISGSQRDRQMLHYYCVDAAKDLSGYPLGAGDFWGSSVLQRAQDQPVLQHALIALASIHKDHVTRTGTSNSDPTAQGQQGQDQCQGPMPSRKTLDAYNKAVRHLRKYMAESTTEPDTTVVIMSCVLLFCFESARAEYDWALKHLQAGLELFKKRPKSDVDEQIYTVLTRLDIQASVFDKNRAPVLELATPAQRAGAEPCVPGKFDNLAQVQNVLDRLQNWMLQFLVAYLPYRSSPLTACPPDMLQESHVLATQLFSWFRAFDAYTDKLQATERDDLALQAKVAPLRVWRRLCDHILSADLSHIIDPELSEIDDKFYDLLEELETLVAIEQSKSNTPEGTPAQETFGAADLLFSPSKDNLAKAHAFFNENKSNETTDSSRSEQRIPNKGKSSSSCKMTVAAPLFFVTFNCNDPEMRRRILNLLSARSRRDGMIDSVRMSEIMERVLGRRRRSEDVRIDCPPSRHAGLQAIKATTEGPNKLAHVFGFHIPVVSAS